MESVLDEATGKPAQKVLVETRGQGGYFIAPPSPAACHPSGRLYVHVAGPALTSIEAISPEERTTLLNAARTFNRIPIRDARIHSVSGTCDTSGDVGTRPGDEFRKRTTWEAILQPAGWKIIQRNGETIYWARPGKTTPGWSATTGFRGDRLRVFSSLAYPFEQRTSYSKFYAFALLTHGGDFRKAATDLAARGFGAGTTADVLLEIADFVKAEKSKTSLRPVTP